MAYSFSNCCFCVLLLVFVAAAFYLPLSTEIKLGEVKSKATYYSDEVVKEKSIKVKDLGLHSFIFIRGSTATVLQTVQANIGSNFNITAAAQANQGSSRRLQSEHEHA